MKADEVSIQTGNTDKIARYKWGVVDSKGQLQWIDKTKLEVDPTYQRTHSSSQVLNMAKDWSWIACGVINVACRKNNGEPNYLVMDGQHRVLASLKRSDITSLPCIIFETNDISEEAHGFVRTNTNRRNVRSLDKFRANLIVGDADTIELKGMLKKYNIEFVGNNSPKVNVTSIRSVSDCMKLIKVDKEGLDKTLSLLSKLCYHQIIPEKLLMGFFYISKHLSVPITDIKLEQRILKYTSEQLVQGANKSSAYYAKGGDKIWAMGILETINSGLHNRYLFKN